MLLLFATEFGIDRGQVRKAVRTFAESAFRDTENRAEERLRESTDLPASRFFHKVVAVPHGLQTLIGMRDDIRKAVRADDLAGVTGGKALAEKSFGQVGDLSLKENRFPHLRLGIDCCCMGRVGECRTGLVCCSF